jgi:hypothetical protein
VHEEDPEHALLSRVEAMIAASEDAVPGLPDSLRSVVGPAVCAALLAGTPQVPV